jgi:hypothetical protein
MSADNGIYIVKFPDGYRVAHAQAVENIDLHPPGSAERKETLKGYFGDSDIYPSWDHAYAVAFDMAQGYEILEYGIQDLECKGFLNETSNLFGWCLCG